MVAARVLGAARLAAGAGHAERHLAPSTIRSYQCTLRQFSECVLVATGALPARDEHLVQLERWITHTVASRADRQEKEILRSYAVWHVVRRLRQRTRGTHATCGQADVARRNIAAAAAFLDWLTARGLTLASCPHGDLDEWMAAASTSQRGPAGHFIRSPSRSRASSCTWPRSRPWPARPRRRDRAAGQRARRGPG